MSQIAAVHSLDGAIAPSTSRFSELSSEDFIRIIFTELANQDPFEPSDSSALLDQLNSIRSIESDLRLTQQLEALVLENQLASAGNLIGRLVSGRTQSLDLTAGFVISVVREDGGVTLQLDNGDRVPIANVIEIVDATLASPVAE